jgi:hypothetical protein
MRLAAPLASSALCAAIGAASACAGDATPPRAPALRAAEETHARQAEPPPAYVLADLERLSSHTALALDGDGFGAVLGKTRVVSQGGTVRFVPEVTEAFVERVERAPGGGFLFFAHGAVYASDTFDGPLRPVVALADNVSRVWFGPKGMLVRSNAGERWYLTLPGGAPLPPLPLGLVEIASLSDGRAAALADVGRALVSTDRGERWIDVTADLAAPPASVVVQRPPGQAAELWITDTGKQAYRVEPGGAVRAFDRLPYLPDPPLRPRDPAWHGREPPLVAAVRRGARIDGDRAVVAAGGDVVQVHLRTGAIAIVAAGRLPPDLPCDAVSVSGDVLFVCAARGRPSVVMTAGTFDRPSRLERTFPNEGPFYAGDDGSLVYGGSCDGGRMGTAACARTESGEWRDVSIDADLADAGAPAAKAPPVASKPGATPSPLDPRRVLRWIPRPGGRPLAVVQDGAIPAVFDPLSGLLRSFKEHEDAWKRAGAVTAALATHAPGSGAPIVDHRWTGTLAGALHGWLEHGQAALVTPDGNVALTAFHFARASSHGPFGLAEDSGGRVFQSTDRGDTWIEVAGLPISGAHGLTACTDVGCELSPWVRLGWEATRPVPRPEPTRAPPAPTLPRGERREIACTPLREERLVALATNPQSPDDFGFGARRVPVAAEGKKGGSSAYRRRFFSRGVVNPPLGSADDERALRGLVHGYAADFTAVPDAKSPLDGILVHGPSSGAQTYRREIAFLAPFDPGAAVGVSSFDLAALLPFARAENTSLAQLFPGEGPDVDTMVAILPVDPAAPSGLVFSIVGDGVYVAGTLYADARGGKQVKRTLGALVHDQATMTSAVELGPGEVAALAVASDGSEDVLRIAAGTVARLHHLPGPPDRLHLANPDALAVGPQGALAVIRTPSGSEPPSKSDPALLIPFGGGAPTALAPWSTLTAADDPACRNEPGGYRAIVVSTGSWVRVRGAAAAGPMSARVRWTASRVCLEAIEAPDEPRTVRSGDEVAVSVVARFAGAKGSSAARIGVAPGAELRQPLTCTLSAPLTIAAP